MVILPVTTTPPLKIFDPVVANDPVCAFVTNDPVCVLVTTGAPLLVIEPLVLIDPVTFNEPDSVGILFPCY